MQTDGQSQFARTAQGRAAAAIIGKCVHCGFCLATCPSYQVLGNELDSPRGRIYLVKSMLEGGPATRSTQRHLDQCLTCLACQTTCPSGVEYGRLAEIGKLQAEKDIPRRAVDKVFRWVLRRTLTSALAPMLVRAGSWVRPVLPKSLHGLIPKRGYPETWVHRSHARKVLMLAGCVQPSLRPNINVATAKVFDALGIEVRIAQRAGCCGALDLHLNDREHAQFMARRNIDAWWSEIESGAEAIVVNASGCGVMVADYAHLLEDDPAYAAKAERVSALCRDPVEMIPALLDAKRKPTATGERIAFHAPCSLQHGLKITGAVEKLLRYFGAVVTQVPSAHLCCGSAGTYSILQPKISRELRHRKLETLLSERPQRVLSANIGCITHLAAASSVPVEHWIEWLQRRLEANGLEEQL